MIFYQLTILLTLISLYSCDPGTAASVPAKVNKTTRRATRKTTRFSTALTQPDITDQPFQSTPLDSPAITDSTLFSTPSATEATITEEDLQNSSVISASPSANYTQNVTDTAPRAKTKRMASTVDPETAAFLKVKEKWFVVTVIILSVLLIALTGILLLLVRKRVNDGEKVHEIFQVK